LVSWIRRIWGFSDLIKSLTTNNLEITSKTPAVIGDQLHYFGGFEGAPPLFVAFPLRVFGRFKPPISFGIVC
jgi:hypothetical protein